jgi:2-oxoglutarate dehydrogenase E2 component (dihydrolipoamide succinyltransferase)
MAVEIKVPSIAESITEGILSRWLKKDGEAVRAGEPLFELETDKATQDIPSPADGVLAIAVPEGTRVDIGSVVGRVDPKGKARPRQEGNGPSADKAAAAPPKPAKKEKEKEKGKEAEPQEALLSPAARQLVADAGVDVRQLKGTGREGRITKEDVLNYLGQQPAAGPRPSANAQKEAAPGGIEDRGSRIEDRGSKADSPRPSILDPRSSILDPTRAPEVPVAEAPKAARPAGAGTPPQVPGPPAAERRERMSAIRQRIAARLVEAQRTAAILTTFNEVDMAAVMALRAKYKEAFQKKHGVALGFMGFFVKATVEALRAFPVVNARIDGSDIVYPPHVHLGVAVSTEKGLMVPVVRDCEHKSFAQIEQDIAELARKAREGGITVHDLQGGTFTITNGGVFGSLLSTPILNPPQSGILGMHAIQKRAVVVDDQVVVRPMMYVALSYDHRIIDGREAVRFLVRVKECIEGPERLLLDV